MASITYRNRPLRGAVRGGVAAVFVMAMFATWATPTAATVFGANVVMAATAATAWRFVLRTRVDVDDDGVHVVNPFSEHHLDWDHIADISTRRGPVRITTDDGHIIVAWATVQAGSNGGIDLYSEACAADLRNRQAARRSVRR